MSYSSSGIGNFLEQYRKDDSPFLMFAHYQNVLKYMGNDFNKNNLEHLAYNDLVNVEFVFKKTIDYYKTLDSNSVTTKFLYSKSLDSLATIKTIIASCPETMLKEEEDKKWRKQLADEHEAERREREINKKLTKISRFLMVWANPF